MLKYDRLPRDKSRFISYIGLDIGKFNTLYDKVELSYNKVKKKIWELLWFSISLLMIIGFLAAYNYNILLSLYLTQHRNSGCNCIIYRNALLYYMERKARIADVNPLNIAIIGFPIGFALALLTFFHVKITGYLFTASSLIVSVTLIPYLLLIESQVGIICWYCSIMQLCTILSAIFSFIWFIKSIR